MLELEEHLFERARNTIAKLRPLMDREDYNKQLGMLARDFDDGEFAFTGERCQKFIKRPDGMLYFVSLIFQCPPAEIMNLMADDSRQDEILSLMNLVLAESFPGLAEAGEETVPEEEPPPPRPAWTKPPEPEAPPQPAISAPTLPPLPPLPPRRTPSVRPVRIETPDVGPPPTPMVSTPVPNFQPASVVAAPEPEPPPDLEEGENQEIVLVPAPVQDEREMVDQAQVALQAYQEMRRKQAMEQAKHPRRQATQATPPDRMY